MIIVHINPAGVEKIYFQAGSELAEDLSMAVWPLVRKELNRLHQKLQKAAMDSMEMVGECERPDKGQGRGE
jgi:hypothetical protein